MNVKLTVSAAALLAVIAGASAAETIRATSGFGPAHVLATDLFPEVNTRLSEFTEGAWDLNDTPSGLVAPNEMSAGLRDGVTEMGTLLMPYYPADYPESALVSELSFLGSNNFVVSAAATEYTVTCAECQAEFARNGQVYLGSDATPTYNLLTTRPVRSVADMRGVRIRTGSPLYASLVERMGGVAVQMPSSELFESLSQGVIDGTFSATHEIIANRLGDVIHYVTEVEEGVFNGASIASSAILWDRMSAEERQALARATQYGIGKALIAFNRDAEDARSVEGIEFIPMDDTLRTARDEFNTEHLANAAQILEGRGVTNAAEKIARYEALIEKWEGLIQPDMSYEDMAQLRYDEIFANLDLASYGQN
ncbi:MAG: C4-dicarboxylate TRAP transporter substrate-binding protein [Paracoccus sp. (in: a-proteobacteria)]|nr:C4-dicarboxylate TRAP transporter substrate-binding protein [Paracoccus sp. (in: a-proteobacteria)]